MKKSILISAAIVTLAMLASCQKEQFTENAAPATGVTEFFATIEQTTKTAIDADGKVSWKAGDEITVTDAASNTAVYVSGSDGAGTTFTLKTGGTAVGDSPYTATYGDIDNQIYDAAGANCPLSAPATSTTTFKFASPYAVVKITAKSEGGEVIDSVGVSYGGNDYTLDCGDGVTLTSDGNDFYVAVEPATDAALSVTFHTAGKTATKERKTAVTLVAKDLLPVTFTFVASDWKSPEADLPDGTLKGVFTVSAGPDGIAGTDDDVKVYFSKGNLYCSRTSSETNDWTWHFYGKQYQFNSIPTTDGNRTAQTSDTEIDLFTWGYSQETSLLPDRSTYVTAHTSTEDKQLVYNTDSGDDWGVAYCNSNNIAVGTWRTLTSAEWQYLFNTRKVNGEAGAGHSYSRNINYEGKMGVVLYPDGYKDAVLSSSTEYTDETFPTDCIFLPAAGFRFGSNVSLVGGYGFYWSSTAGVENFAYFVSFDSYSVTPYSGDRYQGYSVRLVTNVSAAPTPTPADGTRGTLNGHEYVVVAGVKWATQNLAITDSGNKKWKGANTGDNPEVKVPGTDDNVIVGDYFQWAASYDGYNVTENQEPDSLLLYTSFTNTCCGDTKDELSFIGSKLFNVANAPYGGSSYSKYTSCPATLGDNDDVAHIILGGNWHMPTSAEFQDLHDATYWAWDDADKGYYVFTPGENHTAGTNAASIPTGLNKSDALLFFPATGGGSGSSISNAGVDGRYWSSTLYDNTAYQGYTNYAHDLYVYMTGVSPQAASFRYLGRPIRPVSD